MITLTKGILFIYDSGCPQCGVSKSIHKIFVEDKKQTVKPRNKKLYHIHLTDWKRAKTVYACGNCRLELYDLGNKEWLYDLPSYIDKHTHYLQLCGKHLDLIGNDLTFFSNGGENDAACFWFLDVQYRDWLEKYNQYLSLVGVPITFPPIPPRLLDMEEPSQENEPPTFTYPHERGMIDGLPIYELGRQEPVSYINTDSTTYSGDTANAPAIEFIEYEGPPW